MDPFAGKVAIVTGCASGIGRALCERLARARAIVIAADIDASGAETVASAIRAAGGEVEAVALDVTDADAFGRVVDGAIA